MSKSSQALLLIFLLAAGCRGKAEQTPTVEAVPPTPSPLPSATPSPTPVGAALASPAIKGDPKELIVQPEDLPTVLQAAVGEYDGPDDYTVAYLDPGALSESPAGTDVIAVVVNLNLHADAAAAEKAFEAQGGLDRASIAGGFSQAAGGEATVLSTEPLPVTLEHTQALIAFRVHYAIGNTPVIDYRCRFTVANALVNAAITALAAGPGEEPAAFGNQATAILERQIARLRQ